jgi:hypothetical protein
MLAVYSLTTHFLLCFLFGITVSKKKLNASIPFLAMFGPIITSLMFLAACLWVLFDHEAESGILIILYIATQSGYGGIYLTWFVIN